MCALSTNRAPVSSGAAALARHRRNRRGRPRRAVGRGARGHRRTPNSWSAARATSRWPGRSRPRPPSGPARSPTPIGSSWRQRRNRASAFSRPAIRFITASGPSSQSSSRRDEMTCFPQPSAFSLAAARLGWSLPDCACISLHGRALERVIPHLQPGARILALSWDGTTPERLAALLRERGFGASHHHGSRGHGRPARDDQARRPPTAFDLPDVDPLNVVAIDRHGRARCPHRHALARPRRRLVRE